MRPDEVMEAMDAERRYRRELEAEVARLQEALEKIEFEGERRGAYYFSRLAREALVLGVG